MLLLRKILTCEPYVVPTKKAIPILLIPIIIFILYVLNIIPSFFYKLDQHIFIILYSTTVAFKYVESYISKVKGKKSIIFFAAFAIIFFSSIFTLIGCLLVNSLDPQNLKNSTINLFDFLHKDIINFVFVGIGEELLCFYIMLIFLALIKNKYKLVISIILTSFIFGMLHAIKWPVTSTIPIFLNHIPYIYSYNKFKSLLPAMVAHFFFDAQNMLVLIPGFSSVPMIVIASMFIILMPFAYNDIKKFIYD